MGEYRKPVNVTRREYIHPHDLDHGLKIMEWNWAGSAVIAMMDERCPAEDVVVALSDYGNKRVLRGVMDPYRDEIPDYEELDEYTRISRSSP